VDVRDARALSNAVAGCDALVSTIGTGTSGKPTDLYSQATANELQAMADNSIPTIEVISAAPAGPRDEQPWIQRRILFPVLDRLFAGAYRDMQRMETTLQQSDIEWIALRPPRLVNRPPKGAYRIDTKPLPSGRSITLSDLAAALLDLLPRVDLRGRPLYVAN
jgi:putative NADH-flavin reductase